MQGVFLDSKSIDQQDLDFKPLTSTLAQWDLYPQTLVTQIEERIKNAYIVVTNKAPLTAQTMAKAKKLRFICAAATGYDHIDLVAAKQHNIQVCNVRGYSTASVIQHTIGLLINLAARINDYHQLVQKGAWKQAKFFCLQDFKTTELAGKILGIVGYGAIGQGVARVAQQLGMKVLVAQRPGQPLQADRVPLEALLSQVDVLSLHCPLTPQTRHIIDAKALSKLKPQALLLNVSRGGLIDEQALADALLAGHLGGVGLDVSAQEPPSADSPLWVQPLPRLIVTPHVAWATYEARSRLLNEITLNVKAFLEGVTRNQVALA